MKATVLVDNIPGGALAGEWGLSIYIEYNGQNILLDTGASDLFLKNAKALGCPIERVNWAALSHAHYDHANGMRAFFTANQATPFYIQRAAAENCYAKKGIFPKYIGLPRHILSDYSGRIVPVDGVCTVAPGVHLVGHQTPGLAQLGRREHMMQKRGLRWFADDFSHEQSLVFETDRGLVIFNSCSHGGAANIIAEAARAIPGKTVYGLIGGFHLFNKTEPEIRSLAAKIKDTGISYICTGHCTMDRAYRILQEELGNTLHQLQVGLVMEF